MSTLHNTVRDKAHEAREKMENLADKADDKMHELKGEIKGRTDEMHRHMQNQDQPVVDADTED